MEIPKGISHISCHLSAQNLSNLDQKIGLVLEDSESKSSTCVNTILENNTSRGESFSSSYSFAECSRHCEATMNSSIVTSSIVNRGANKVTEGNSLAPGSSTSHHIAAGCVQPVELKSGSLEVDPSSPDRDILEDKSSIQIVDLVEAAWNKIESRKKNKNKNKKK